MIIQYRIRQVYGKDTMYPANKDAEMVCAITGRKTLLAMDLRILADNGHKSEQVI